MSSTSDFFDCPRCGGNAHRDQDNNSCEVSYGCSNCDWKGEPVNMRKVTVELKVKMLVKVDQDVEISEVIDELEYNFSSPLSGADVIVTEIADYEVKDSI